MYKYLLILLSLVMLSGCAAPVNNNAIDYSAIKIDITKPILPSPQCDVSTSKEGYKEACAKIIAVYGIYLNKYVTELAKHYDIPAIRDSQICRKGDYSLPPLGDTPTITADVRNKSQEELTMIVIGYTKELKQFHEDSLAIINRSIYEYNKRCK